MPTNIANYIPDDIFVNLQSENGMLGMGAFPTEEQVDPDLINAGKQTVSELLHSSYFDSASSFGMIRGGYVDLTVLGALQVSESGDLANWCIPGKMIKGMGGAMDLVSGAKRVVVMMDHVAKDGSPKLIKQCAFPLTGVAVVHRLITDLGIFDFENGKVFLVSVAPDVSVDEIRSKTEAEFEVSMKEMKVAI